MHIREYSPEAEETVLFLHGGNVAGWMWHHQVAELPDHHSLVPDLPGFGASSAIPWRSLEEVVDALADIVRERAHGGRAHVVGLSLGGVLGTLLAARHPEVVRSTFVSGAAIDGVGGLTRAAGLWQLRLWGWVPYWRGLAKAFRLPTDSVAQFVTTGIGIDRPSARRMMSQVYAGLSDLQLAGLADADFPLLTVAGEKEPGLVTASLKRILRLAPRAKARLAPGMHHVWSGEDPELFHRVLKHWLAYAEPSPELLPLALPQRRKDVNQKPA